MRDQEACRWCEWICSMAMVAFTLVLGVLFFASSQIMLADFRGGDSSGGTIGVAVCIFIGTLAIASAAYSFVLARHGFMGPKGWP